MIIAVRGPGARGGQVHAATVESEDPLDFLCAVRRHVHRRLLRRAEATQVLIAWDRVWVALGRPGALGTSKAEASEHEAERLRSITKTRHRLRPHAC